MTAAVPRTRIGKASDHLANERTFLAWIRTSISIIVFGFVVAKFGITLREFLRMQGNTTHDNEMSPANAIVIVLGLIAALFGTILAAYLIYTARTL
jgi:putative membrane protein